MEYNRGTEMEANSTEGLINTTLRLLLDNVITKQTNDGVRCFCEQKKKT